MYVGKGYVHTVEARTSDPLKLWLQAVVSYQMLGLETKLKSCKHF